ncbi:hypothetical protein [Streptomyces hokutonensis]|nr:hypothetical protein [Streptomyces hokutonensis]
MTLRRQVLTVLKESDILDDAERAALVAARAAQLAAGDNPPPARS